MDKNDLISIIIPVYNVMEFLPQCLDSILKQTYNFIEIIVVDDGSTDNSGQICDEYAKKDNRIKVIHKENGGLSDARNVGIDNASGDYICFVDSDDVVDENFVKCHYDSIIKTNSCLSICTFQKFSQPTQLTKVDNVDNFKFEECDKHELTMKLFTKNNLHFICACTKMYKKSLFNGLRFDKGKLHEDEFIVYKIFDATTKAVLIDAPLYYYRERQGSITKTATFKEKNLDAFYAVESCYNFYKNTRYEQFALNRLVNCIACIYCTAKQRNADKQILQFLLKMFKQYYKINKNKTLKQRLFNMFPNVICKLKKC